MIIDILIPIISMTVLGLVFGVGLAYALKIFGVEVDPTVALIITKLPGANCGVCGKAGCGGFAEALKKGEAIPLSCAVSNEEARKAISEILGIEYDLKIKKIAVVLCNGGATNAKDKYKYRGIKSCSAAPLVMGGYKYCSFGCLGLGDCREVCPFDAIEITNNRIPKVDPEKCTGCGKCVSACPRKIIELMPYNVDNLVVPACRSTDGGAVVRKICSVGCIGCKICEKLSGGVFAVENNLSRLKIDRMSEAVDWEEVIKKCPTKTIVRIK